MVQLSSVLILMVTVCAVSCLKDYQANIPNGDNVPHPCIPNYIWEGVGHEHLRGGGVRNPFGLDYAAHRDWPTLCRRDSDGDGRTNGQELGDPSCTWVKGALPDNNTGLSHPGVCEPMESAMCAGKNDWVDCSVAGFECDGLNSSDVQNTTVRFPQWQIPSDETTYACFPFNLPDEDDYHLIALEAVISNAFVVHHMILTGCSDTSSIDLTATKPFPCGMQMPGCTNNLGGWGVGFAGQCYNKKMGVSIGKNAVKTAILQIHYNNPLHKEDQFDSSGLKLYYTTHKRQYDAQIMALGQMSLTIQPGLEYVAETSTCSSDCTRTLLKEPIYVVSSSNHMHYMGRYGNTVHKRNGTVLRNIGFEPDYSYDRSTIFTYDPPIEILPGDELITTCGFSSTSKGEVTTFGEATSDEMCFAYLTYYPNVTMHTNLLMCLSYKDLGMCKMQNEETNEPVVNGCNYVNFQNTSQPDTKKIVDAVLGACVFDTCTDECRKIADDTFKHPCLQGALADINVGALYAQPRGPKFIAALTMCALQTSGGKELLPLSWSLLLLLICPKFL